MASQLYAYRIYAMDFGWSLLPTTNAYQQALLSEKAGGQAYYPPTEAARAMAEFAAFYDDALEAGGQVKWEGDFRPGHEPRVLVLPNDGEPALGLVWKQENNGDTFVVSQVPLAYLEESSSNIWKSA